MKTISVAFFTGFYGTMKRNKPAAIINQTVKIVKMTRQLIILKAIFHFTDPKKIAHSVHLYFIQALYLVPESSRAGN